MQTRSLISRPLGLLAAALTLVAMIAWLLFFFPTDARDVVKDPQSGSSAEVEGPGPSPPVDASIAGSRRASQAATIPSRGASPRAQVLRPDGSPQSGVEVTLWTDGPLAQRNLLTTTASDASGRVSAPAEHGEGLTFTLVPGQKWTEIDQRTGRDGEHKIFVGRTRSLELRVSQPDGSPLMNRDVTLALDEQATTPRAFEAPLALERQLLHLRTDSRGAATAQITTLDSELTAALGCHPYPQGRIERHLGDQDPVLIEIQLDPPLNPVRRLRGRVLLPSGDVAAVARVSIGRNPLWTDAMGEFAADVAVSTLPIEVTARLAASLFAAQVLQPDDAAWQDGSELVLRLAEFDRHLKCRFLLPGGQPVAGARVSLLSGVWLSGQSRAYEQTLDHERGSATRVTNEDGEIHFQHLRDTPYDLRIISREHGVAEDLRSLSPSLQLQTLTVGAEQRQQRAVIGSLSDQSGDSTDLQVALSLPASPRSTAGPWVAWKTITLDREGEFSFQAPIDLPLVLHVSTPDGDPFFGLAIPIPAGRSDTSMGDRTFVRPRRLDLTDVDLATGEQLLILDPETGDRLEFTVVSGGGRLSQRLDVLDPETLESASTCFVTGSKLRVELHAPSGSHRTLTVVEDGQDLKAVL